MPMKVTSIIMVLLTKNLITVIVLFVFHSKISLAAQLNDYQIQKCKQKSDLCWTLEGSVAFISNDGTYFSAEKGSLEILNLKHQTREHWNCHSLNYNLKNELLICDNSDMGDTGKKPSVLIDAQFKVTKLK